MYCLAGKILLTEFLNHDDHPDVTPDQPAAHSLLRSGRSDSSLVDIFLVLASGARLVQVQRDPVTEF